MMSIMEVYRMKIPEPDSKEWFYLNAICMWLKHYPNHQWTSKYEELKNELINPPQIQRRGRPAKRQRKKEAATNKAS